MDQWVYKVWYVSYHFRFYYTLVLFWVLCVISYDSVDYSGGLGIFSFFFFPYEFMGIASLVYAILANEGFTGMFYFQIVGQTLYIRQQSSSTQSAVKK